MENKMKLNLKDKKTIILIILIGLIAIGLLVFGISKILNKPKEITPDNPTITEFENYLKDSIKGFDEETIKDFIASTDNVGTVDNTYWGVMYSGYIGPDIKVLYALSRLFFDDSDLINYMIGSGMYDEKTELGDVKLSINFINKVLAAKFKDTKIEKNTVYTNFFLGINAVICDDTYCIIPISKTKIKDSNETSDGLYATKDLTINKQGNTYEVTADYYYYELSFTGEMKFGIYDNAFKDTTYCETSLLDIYLGDATGLGADYLPDSCKKDITYNKIKYTFDKNYKFINTEKV